MSGHTPGPWPITHTGDGKRITIGDGLVEGPNGYEVAEVYLDDCPRGVAEANARLIAAAPDLLEACRAMLEWDEMEKNAPPFDSDGGKHFYARMDKCAESFALARTAIAKVTPGAAS